MHGLIIHEGKAFKISLNFRVDFWNSFCRLRSWFRQVIFNFSGWEWPLGWPWAPRGLQEPAALFAGVLALFWWCSAGDLLQTITYLMLLPSRLQQKEGPEVFCWYLVLWWAEGCLSLCCYFLHQQNRELQSVFLDFLFLFFFFLL